MVHHDAWRLFQHVGKRFQLEIVHALARHHRDRLRRLAQAQRKAGGRGAGAGLRVAARALGGAAAVGGRSDRDRCQRAIPGAAAAQRVAAIAAQYGFQSAAGEQAVERLAGGVHAAQARALQSVGDGGVEGESDARAGGKTCEAAAQRAWGNVEGLGRSPGRRRALRERRTVQGQAQQACAQGELECGGGKLAGACVHACFLGWQTGFNLLASRRRRKVSAHLKKISVAWIDADPQAIEATADVQWEGIGEHGQRALGGG